MFKYNLYGILMINGIPMWKLITSIYAENIVEAEFKVMSYRHSNNYSEFVLTMVN